MAENQHEEIPSAGREETTASTGGDGDTEQQHEEIPSAGPEETAAGADGGESLVPLPPMGKARAYALAQQRSASVGAKAAGDKAKRGGKQKKKKVTTPPSTPQTPSKLTNTATRRYEPWAKKPKTQKQLDKAAAKAAQIASKKAAHEDAVQAQQS
ncbi:hypothetical protein BBJ28_00014650 [Nothophytophthora sp. Chile5]|nr:hypothetical protein BBJ28_00014650 [Nothophytophthora sp. Chile5]